MKRIPTRVEILEARISELEDMVEELETELEELDETEENIRYNINCELREIQAEIDECEGGLYDIETAELTRDYYMSVL